MCERVLSFLVDLLHFGQLQRMLKIKRSSHTIYQIQIDLYVFMCTRLDFAAASESLNFMQVCHDFLLGFFQCKLLVRPVGLCLPLL